MGIVLAPEFTNGFARWVAPLSGAAAASGGSAAEPQTVFQIMPQPGQGTTEYTIVIDGQQLRYRNTPPQWANFVWPNPQGSAGATLTATSFDGRSIELVNEPGRYGLEKLINSAQRTRNPDGTFSLKWTQGSVTVALSMRIISTSQPTSGGGDAPQQQSLRGARLPESVADAAAARTAAAQASGSAPAQAASSDAATATPSPIPSPSAANTTVTNTGAAQ
jgi:type VI secretion system protein ImpL